MFCCAIILFAVNAVAALVTAGSAASEALKPGRLNHEELTGAARFYSRLYSIRGIPLGVAVAIGPFLILCDAGAGIVAALLVLVASCVQASDFVLLARRDGFRLLTIAAAVAAAVHLTTAIVLFGGWALIR